MSNHLHIIASATDEDSLSDILRDFKKFTSKAIIKEIKEVPELNKVNRRSAKAKSAEQKSEGVAVELVLVCRKKQQEDKNFQGVARWQRCQRNSFYCIFRRKDGLYWLTPIFDS